MTEKIIKLHCADTKTSRILEMDYDELILGDGYLIHRAKGRRESSSEKMGDGIFEELKFDYEYYYLKNKVGGVGIGFYNGEECYCVSIELIGLDRENIAWVENMDEGKEIVSEVRKWLLEK